MTIVSCWSEDLGEILCCVIAAVAVGYRATNEVRNTSEMSAQRNTLELSIGGGTHGR